MSICSTDTISSARTLVFLTLFSLVGVFADATHYIGGYIYYRHLYGYTYEIVVHTCTKHSSHEADEDFVHADMGDGTVDTLWRRTKTEIPAHNLIISLYVDTHTYAGPFTYWIIMEDPNRDSGVLNITNSVNVPIYLQSMLGIFDPQAVGPNNSPVMLDECQVRAVVNQPFYFMPVAYDPDGDSLVFYLTESKTIGGFPAPGYVFPDQVSPANDTFTINHSTGLVSWLTPKIPGLYNFGIVIEEYRNGLKVGTVLRDVRIIVTESPNRAPRVSASTDYTCVRVGDTLRIPFQITDPNGDPLDAWLTGELAVQTPAPQVVLTSSRPDSLAGYIEWVPECGHVRSLPYMLILRASDNPSDSAKLTAYHAIKVKVIGPPDSLWGTVSQQKATLQWLSPYICDGKEPFWGFEVWRRPAPNPFIPAYCQTGLDGYGYTRIADNIRAYTYIDSPLTPGIIYCYRILPEYYEGRLPFVSGWVEGVASNEVCLMAPATIPVLINVSVEKTHNDSGVIFVRWIRPDPTELDTVANPPPYRVVVERASGLSPAGGWTPVFDRSFPSFSAMTDTFFYDSLLNTASTPYSYRIIFYSSGNNLGTGVPASSVWLEALPGDATVTLRWQFNVPWYNYRYTIYRKLPSSPTFDSLTTVYTTTYTDTALTNGREYCYVVRPATGGYTAPGYPVRLDNNSQIVCAIPTDTTPPCQPHLRVHTACELLPVELAWSDSLLTNRIEWQFPDSKCASDAHHSYLLYKPTLTTEQWDTLAVFAGAPNSFFNHTLNGTLAGCYTMVVKDSFGNWSPLTQTACVDNCPLYRLPNTFTPNGDGYNDLFIPYLPYRFVAWVDFRVFDRWGTLVYQTTNPMLLWDGTDQSSGKKVTPGTYYYTCRVFVRSVKGTVPGTDLHGFIYVVY